jgi:oxaloacetate decarboxylase alpha subunit
LKKVRDKYLQNGVLDPKVYFVEPKTLLYQVPGGMLSNLISQLKALNAENKFDEVLKEIPAVREDLGFPPLVTPLSQMVGSQAVFNVIMGERYKMVPKEVKKYVQGYYGKPPAPISDEIKTKIIGNDEVITKRLEDVLSYVLFPQPAKDFLENRKFNSYKTAEGYVG